MPLIIIIQSNKKEKIKCQIETICNQGHGQSSGLPPVASFVPLGCSQSVVPPSVPQTTCHQKKEQPRKMAALFLLSAFPVSTRSLPAFVGATASATQTRKKNAGQCLRPPPLIFSAVALSHSHRGLLRYHFAFE